MPRRRVQHRFEGILEEKHCSTCDEWKVLKEFSKHKITWDGLESRCKVCRSIADEKRRRKLGMKPRRTEHRFQGDLEQKHCLTCDQWKVLKEFNKHKHNWDGLESRCKGCKAVAHKKQVSTEFGRERVRTQQRKHKKNE